MLAVPTKQRPVAFAVPAGQQEPKQNPEARRHCDPKHPALQGLQALGQRGQAGRKNQLTQPPERKAHAMWTEREQPHIEERRRQHGLMPPERPQQEKRRSPASTNVAPALQPVPPRLRALGLIRDEPYE